MVIWESPPCLVWSFSIRELPQLLVGLKSFFWVMFVPFFFFTNPVSLRLLVLFLHRFAILRRTFLAQSDFHPFDPKKYSLQILCFLTVLELSSFLCPFPFDFTPNLST